jgi:hypothetical protein
MGGDLMISMFCDTDDWSPTLNKIIEETPKLNDLNVHISINCLSLNADKKFNILVLQESPGVLNNRNVLQFLNDEKNYKKYDKIYSCITSLPKNLKIEYIHPSNISWVKNPIFLPNKTKLVSMISSNNAFLPGHIRRLNILNSVKDFVDVYGRGFNPIKEKDEGLVDYYYSIAIENDNTNNYFSEKLIDCFLTCTIPIYWGCSYVKTIFNPAGIIDINEIQDLKEIKTFSKDYYIKNIDAVVDNYFEAHKQNRYLSHTLKQILLKFHNEIHN